MESHPALLLEADVSEGPAEILELTDTALVSRLWDLLHPDSAAPAGQYQILIPTGPQLSTGQELSASVFLLHDGTEAGRIDRAAWQNAALARGRKKTEGWTASLEGAEKHDVPIVWQAMRFDMPTLLRLTEWSSGATLGMGTVIGSVPHVNPQYERSIDFGWRQKLFGHYLLGLELHRTQFGGGLTRSALMDSAAYSAYPPGTQFASPDFWSVPYWWWALSAGVPGLKYTVSLANQPLPEFFWLETAAANLVKHRKPGKVVNQWTGTSLAIQGNFAHTLEARLGYFHYGLHLDQDAYGTAVQTFQLDELPALFGTWGTGLVMASNVLATNVWLDIPDLDLLLAHPESYPSTLRIAFLHFDFSYRNLNSFCLGVSVRLRIDNPIMNSPGARP